MKVNLADLVAFLASLPVIRNLPTSVKKVLGDILTVAVALTGVLAVVASLTSVVHVSVLDQTYLVAATSVVSAVVALLRRELVATAVKQAEQQVHSLP